MYSYDRRKLARRGTADFTSLQDSLKAAQETVTLATQYIQSKGDFYRFLQIDPDLGEAKSLLTTATSIARTLPLLINAAEQIDDAIDAYARTTRRSMPRNREEIDSSGLDQKLLGELQRRAEPAIKEFKRLSQLATDAPTGFEVEDPYDSPKVAAINVMGARLDDLSSEIVFDESEYVDLLENIEDRLVDAINRGPNM